jgi:hypothetical protein
MFVSRWVISTGMDLTDIGCGGMDWIGVVDGTEGWRVLMNTVMDLWGILE